MTENEESLDARLAELKAHYSTSLQEDLQDRLDALYEQYSGAPVEEIAPALREIGGLDREARKVFLTMIHEGERPMFRAEK